MLTKNGGKTGRGRMWTIGAMLGLLALAMFVSACGGSSGGSASNVKGSGKIEGEGKEIVFFSVTTTNPYIREQVESAEAEAKNLGFSIKVETNNFEPAQLQEQIQQEIASGGNPAAFILFALDAKTAINQTRQLSQIAPVFQINQSVEPEGFKYVKAYVGPSDLLIGETAGESLIALRAKLESEGVKLHSPEGNLLGISELPGLQTTLERWEGITKATEKEPFNVLQNYECSSEPEKAYTCATQLLPKYKSELDFVWAQNVDAASGIVKALKQNGLTPGKNVWIVTGNCSGPLAPMADGEVYATGAQLASVEGAAMVQTIAQYLATGEIKEGTRTIPYSEKVPPVKVTPPDQINLLSNPPMIGPKSVSKVVWGKTLQEGCPLN